MQFSGGFYQFLAATILKLRVHARQLGEVTVPHLAAGLAEFITLAD